MELHFWASLVVTNVAVLGVAILMHDIQLVLLSVTMLGYSVYTFAQKAGLL